MKNRHSDYMHWAKTYSKARYNLATSGVGPFPLHALPFDLQQLEINGPSTYGYAPLQSALARKNDVDPDCVVAAAGTSMANHLAMAALLDDGDEVLIETPAYELLVATALYFTSNVKRFTRREEDGYRLDPHEVERVVSKETKLIVLTNLHNPSSALAGEAELRAVGEIARSVGARVLVDEVYLDAVYQNTPRSSFHYGPQFVVTSSLTKVYGLSGLRCGWILAEPELARRMWRLNDLFGSIPAFPAEQLSVAALENLTMIRDRGRQVVEVDRKAIIEFLDRRAELSAPSTEWGTTRFVRLRRGSVDAFLESLRKNHETTAVPGSFFDSPQHFRIGMGVNSEMFREGLLRISKELDNIEGCDG
jgi:aspartate/methionine/tyrosine aminotransferase